MHPPQSLDRLKQLLAAALCLSLARPPATSMAQTAPQPQATPRRLHPQAQQRAARATSPNSFRETSASSTPLTASRLAPAPAICSPSRQPASTAGSISSSTPPALDESDLTSRLAQYPAMQHSPEDLLFRLPSNGVIRQSMNGKGPIPANGTLHAIYEDQIYRVTEKKQEKQDKQQAANSAAKPEPAIAMNPESAASAASARSLMKPLPKWPAVKVRPAAAINEHDSRRLPTSPPSIPR